MKWYGVFSQILFSKKRLSDVFRLPKFSTKTQKRNNILDKLGIN